MPNGRSGAVYVPRDDLMRCFQSIEGNPVVGFIRESDVVLSDVQHLVESITEEALFVEGQYGTALVIHFDEERWLWVLDSNPAYESLFKVWWKALGGSWPPPSHSR